MKIPFLLALVSGLLASAAAHAVDLTEIGRELTTTGVVGWIHGSAEQQGIFVFTYRNPSDFFDYVEMSLVSEQPALTHQLATFHRNDKVRVKGSFMDNPSPQKHILVSSIEMVTPYVSGYSAAPYEHEAKIPDELLNLDSATFLVHAIGGDGHILVVEYKDVVIPVYVKNAALTQGLYRGDLIKLFFKIQGYPNQPTHLNVNETVPRPLQVLEALKDKNGKPVSVEGALILFPKSPEIQFNVFAVQELLPAGLNRQYTLVNMTDPNAFNQIRDKLQKAWDKYPGAYVNGRNKLVSTRIRVKATGKFNEVDPNQANAQIFLDSADAIQVIEQ